MGKLTHRRRAGVGLRGSRETAGPRRQAGIGGTPRSWRSPPQREGRVRRGTHDGDAGVMGSGHSTPSTAPHPAVPRPSDGAGPWHPPPQPPVPGEWEKRASPGPTGSRAQSPTQECSATAGGRAGDPAAWGGGRGVAEGGGRAFGAAAAARAESQAPLCGQGVLPPFSDGLPFSSPLPRRCPRQQRPQPAARNSLT